MAKVLVIGGAGYVGSSNVAWLKDHGHRCWIIDDLATSRRRYAALGDGFTQARAGDAEAVSAIIQREKPDCVMHFAGSTLVSESVAEPEKYFENNVEQTRLLIQTLLKNGVRNLVFSSTCAVFGDPGDQNIHEGLPKKSLSPYAESKIRAEALIQDFCKNQGLRAIVLRYFNAAGAEPQARTGEWHEPETHLIPVVLRAAAQGKTVPIYGTDYPTPDGTAIRDYVHVCDLAAAHETALKKLLELPQNPDGFFEDYNLGSETGYSVREVIAACEKATGRSIQTTAHPKRPGDAKRLVGDSTRAKKSLGYQVRYDLEQTVQSAWAWELKRGERRKAAFLDRDGTINFDPSYLRHPDQLRLLDGVTEALQKLQKAGYLLIVVSNQSGVGRGLIEPHQIPRIHSRLDELLAPSGTWMDDLALCFHRPEDHCPCRKPNAKMILDMAERWNIDLSQSIMIGDRDTDLMAGRNASCGKVGWIESPVPPEFIPAAHLYDFKADSLLGVVNRYLK